MVDCTLRGRDAHNEDTERETTDSARQNQRSMSGRRKDARSKIVTIEVVPGSIIC